MKQTAFVVALVGACGLLAACASSSKEGTSPRYAKKIYLTKEDYLEDLGKVAEMERREAQPNTESEYIFDVTPPTQKNVYFYDEHQQPKVPGEYTAKDYKNEKRLWTKPRRFTPEEYYGMQGDNTGGAPTNSSYEENAY